MQQVSEHWASDLIVTAVESGIGYWAKVLEYHNRVEPYSAVIKEHEPHMMEEKPIRAKLNTGTISLGVYRLAEGRIKVNREVLGAILASAALDGGADGDGCDLDAVAADVVVQAAVFGDLIYG